ncbi:MAG: TonB-dependent receptor [Bryobacter sp.]|nr:TonB-dependent receptor [Bryobacter sp.]
MPRCKLLTLLVFLAAPLLAQNFATITGSVTDKTGASVPAATISALNLDTQVNRETTADASGLFTLPLLPPGRYRISAQKQGFRQAVQDSISLEVNQTARFDFQMEVGQVSETVEVKAGVPLLESDSSAIGQVVEQKAVAELPLNGRNFVQLATLGPGVTGVGFGARGTIMSGTRPDDLRPGSEIFANGNREGSNNFLYDGIDNNERLTLSIVLRPSVEAVREFKIQTSLFSADQGRNSGATVNVISKSGTNEWHGSAYDFLRNDATDARNFFLPNKPTLRQNQFGASLGGKVIKDKVFFFGNYEGFRRRQERAFVNSVPTALTRNGNFSEVRDIFDPNSLRAAPGTTSGFARDPFPGRIIPANRFDPIMARMIQAYPTPTRSGIVNNHTSSPKEAQDWNQWDGRVDFNINERNNLFARYSQQNTVSTRPSTFVNRTIPGLDGTFGLGNEDTFAGDSNLKAFHSVINWIRTITPTFIMEAKFGFNRFDLVFLQEGAEPGAKLGERLGIARSNQGPNSDGLPIFSPAGYTGIGQTRSLPIIRFEDTYNPAFAFTNLRGKHTLKFGVDWRQRRLTQYQTNRGNGRFNFGRTFTDNPNNAAATGDAMAALLLGTASFIEQDFTLFEPRILQWEWNFYVQDDWRVTDRLTINAGLRYERDTPTVEKDDKWTNFDVVTGQLLIAGFNTDSATGVVADNNNFAPRLGFAYRLRPGTVLRGGAGIFYNPGGSESVLMRRHRQLPFGPINTVDINQFVASPRRVSQGLDPIPNLDPATVAANPVGSMLAVDFRFRNGIAQQYNFQIQQSLPKDLVFKIGYVGNMGRRLDNSYNFNQPVPGSAPPAQRRPLRFVAPRVINADYNVSDGLSAYHSLQATLERRFANGLGFLSAYTWANSIDTVPNQFGGGDNGPIPQDARNRRAERAVSGHNIRHRFVHSMNYALPFGKGRTFASNLSRAADLFVGGWDMNVIATLQSGLPFTPTLANSVSNAGGSRPDRFLSGEIDNPTIDRWFDTSLGTAASGAAWGTPAQFTFGNASRNPLFGPGRVNFDYSVFKNFAITEQVKLQFRTEIFNLFNHAQFDLPNGAVGNPNAGRITSIVGTPRQFQFALRLSF